MNTDYLFVVFGSDSRFDFTAEALVRKGFEVVRIRDEAQLKQLTANKKKAIVLPLPFSRDGINVNISSLPRAVTLDEILDSVNEGDIIFGGMLSDRFIKEAQLRKVSCFDYYDGEMINQNAELTAQCLMHLLDELSVDKSALTFAVTGFGRTAKAIAKTFSQSAIRFFVTARSELAENAAKSMNYDFVKLENFTEETHDYDIIINTVPALIFNERTLPALKSGVQIIDVASAPFGITQEDADRYSVKLVRALALPGRYMPSQAGGLIADRIVFYLKGGR